LNINESTQLYQNTGGTGGNGTYHNEKGGHGGHGGAIYNSGILTCKRSKEWEYISLMLS
jgi:hypothetical protein